MFFFTRKYLNGIFHLLNELWIHAAMCKVIHHDQMSSLSSANNQQLMKTNSKFKIQNYLTKQYINRNNQWSFFLSVAFGLVFSKCLLLMSFTIARSGNTWFAVYIYLSSFEEKRRLLYSRSAIPKRPRTSIFNTLAF